MKYRSLILIACLIFFCSSWAEEYKIACGSWIEIAAHPLADHHFVQWNDGHTDSVRQIQVHEDAFYIAYFAANCEEYANWPVVALYDWLLMIDVRAINEMGYYFAPENITWYRVIGQPDDLHDVFPLDDQCVGQDSYYLTLDKNLKGTGNYYAVIDASDSQGILCDGLMRSVIVSYSGNEIPAKLSLIPNAIFEGEVMQLNGLVPEENSHIYIYSTTGQLIEHITSAGQSSIPLHTSYTAGCYQVLVESPSVHQSLRYIVNNR